MRRIHRLSLLLFFASVCLGAAIFSRYDRIRRANVKPMELYSVINSQVNALRTSDFSRAYLHVSSEFKRKYNIVQFTGMIRAEYPALARTDHVEYGAVECNGRRAVIEVYFIDGKDRVIPCIYTLVNEGADWKIENVRLLKKKDARLMLTGILSSAL
ncbi:MAG: DUF4864 domain-containing protein [Verrucomicrobiota bacterium]